MPNKRKEGKSKVGLWLTDEQKNRLCEIAESLDMNLSDVIKLALREFDTNKEEKTKW